MSFWRLDWWMVRPLWNERQEILDELNEDINLTNNKMEKTIKILENRISQIDFEIEGYKSQIAQLEDSLSYKNKERQDYLSELEKVKSIN